MTATERGFRSRSKHGIPVNHLEALTSLLADIGPDVWACGPTAAALHEFDGFKLAPPFHVLIRRGRHLQRVGHHVHTTDKFELIDQESQWDLPITAPTRTLIDLARCTTPAKLTEALDGAIRDGLVGESFLHRRIADLRGPGRNGVRRLLEVIEGSEISRGGHSWLEREYLRLLGEHGLPKPRTQAVLSRRGDRLIRVDCRFEGTPVVVELLGYRWHRTVAQMSVDAERLNQLILDGFHPFQFTYRQVANDPSFVIATTKAALGSWAPLSA